MEYLHYGEVVAFFGEHTKQRYPTPVLIHPGNLTAPWKEMMVPKKDKLTWDYHEYPENYYTI